MRLSIALFLAALAPVLAQESKVEVDEGPEGSSVAGQAFDEARAEPMTDDQKAALRVAVAAWRESIAAEATLDDADLERLPLAGPPPTSHRFVRVEGRAVLVAVDEDGLDPVDYLCPGIGDATPAEARRAADLERERSRRWAGRCNVRLAIVDPAEVPGVLYLWPDPSLLAAPGWQAAWDAIRDPDWTWLTDADVVLLGAIDGLYPEHPLEAAARDDLRAILAPARAAVLALVAAIDARRKAPDDRATAEALLVALAAEQAATGRARGALRKALRGPLLTAGQARVLRRRAVEGEGVDATWSTSGPDGDRIEGRLVAAGGRIDGTLRLRRVRVDAVLAHLLDDVFDRRLGRVVECRLDPALADRVVGSATLRFRTTTEALERLARLAGGRLDTEGGRHAIVVP